jgi:hypothetical protein
MQRNNEIEGAGNAPFNQSQDEHNFILLSLQEIREIALDFAIKYRFDPTIGRIHTSYLNMLNGILRGCEYE